MTEQETRELKRENEILRAEIKEMGKVIDSISALINLFQRESHVVANYPGDTDRLSMLKELNDKFPFLP